MEDRKKRQPKSKESRIEEFILPFCDYCGNDILTDSSFKDHKRYHKSCLSVHSERAKCAIDIFKRVIRNENILLISVHVDYIHGVVKEQNKPRKKIKRDRKLRELSNNVSALRNSGSGYIVIHLVGLSEGETYTGFFDEFADEKLNSLLDGSLFTDVYRKQRMTDCAAKELKQFTDFLVLYVDGASHLTTSAYNTKLALDDSIIEPTYHNISSFLNSKRHFEDQFHDQAKQSARDLTNLQESRSVQFKGYFLSPGEDIVTSVLQKLRVTEYISAFTKLPAGGSYFYGVHEKDKVTIEGHNSKEILVQCIPVSDCDRVEKELKDKIQNSVLVCNYKGEETTNTDFVRVRFIPSCKDSSQCTATSCEERKSNHYVIQVLTKPVSGIVFYDKKGPEAYRFDTDTIKVYSVDEWFCLMLKRSPKV